MRIIKLDAIDSTNSFLRELAQNTSVKNFTTVVTKTQFKGKGQMQTQWISEPNKNLLCSVFCSFNNLLVQQQFYLNYAVSLAIFNVLNSLKVPNLKIKWPNDIMSDNKKIAGILIENTIKNKNISYSVIGVGLNVNQVEFKNLPKATSIKIETNKETDVFLLLKKYLENLKTSITLLNTENSSVLKEEYLKVLYKKDTVAMFKDAKNNLFMAKIVGVSFSGKLQVELQDNSIKEFGLKEISFA